MIGRATRPTTRARLSIRRTTALAAPGIVAGTVLGIVLASTLAAAALGVPDASAAPAPATAPAALSGTETPPHGDREPADTTIANVDGTSVVTQYGRVVPAFDGYDTPQPTGGYVHLDGTWRFRFDPDGVGERLGWHGWNLGNQVAFPYGFI